MIKILDPIVESNRKIFWFLFPEDEEQDVSIYEYNAFNLLVPNVESKDFILNVEGQNISTFLNNINDNNNLLPHLNQSSMLLEENTPPLIGSIKNGNSTPDGSLWWMAILAALFAALLPSLLILLVVSLRKAFSKSKKSLSQIEIPKIVSLTMLAFSSGGLLGDVVFHILPTIFSFPVHSPKSSIVSIAFLCGIFFFWIFELALTPSRSHHSHSSHNSMKINTHDSTQEINILKNMKLSESESNLRTKGSESKPEIKMKEPGPSELNRNIKEPEPIPSRRRSRSVIRKKYLQNSNTDTTRSEEYNSLDVCEEENNSNVKREKWEKKAINPEVMGENLEACSALNPQLNGFAAVQLSADLIHNFTDGLALAAAWSSNAGGSRSLGISTTFAIFLHEIPHELGDIASLVHLANWSFISALRMQLITSAIGSFSGLIIGLLLSNFNMISNFDNDDGSVVNSFGIISTFQSAILPFSAGGFMYMALSIILPQLKSECLGLESKQHALIISSAIAGIFLLALF